MYLSYIKDNKLIQLCILEQIVNYKIINHIVNLVAIKLVTCFEIFYE